MAVLDNLEPKAVFHFFEELCSIPHGTFDTKRISDYCVRFAEERGLEVIQDEANNVIIRKNGTATLAATRVSQKSKSGEKLSKGDVCMATTRTAAPRRNRSSAGRRERVIQSPPTVSE